MEVTYTTKFGKNVIMNLENTFEPDIFLEDNGKVFQITEEGMVFLVGSYSKWNGVKKQWIVSDACHELSPIYLGRIIDDQPN